MGSTAASRVSNQNGIETVKTEPPLGSRMKRSGIFTEGEAILIASGFVNECHDAHVGKTAHQHVASFNDVRELVRDLLLRLHAGVSHLQINFRNHRKQYGVVTNRPTRRKIAEKDGSRRRQ